MSVTVKEAADVAIILASVFILALAMETWNRRLDRKDRERAARLVAMRDREQHPNCRCEPVPAEGSLPTVDALIEDVFRAGGRR